jgi:hypothetical protein
MRRTHSFPKGPNVFRVNDTILFAKLFYFHGRKGRRRPFRADRPSASLRCAPWIAKQKQRNGPPLSSTTEKSGLAKLYTQPSQVRPRFWSPSKLPRLPSLVRVIDNNVILRDLHLEQKRFPRMRTTPWSHIHCCHWSGGGRERGMWVGGWEGWGLWVVGKSPSGSLSMMEGDVLTLMMMPCSMIGKICS